MRKITHVLDYVRLKEYIDEAGIKQKAISEKADLSEVQLSLILNGKRKCDVGEYASICSVLGVELDKFINKSDNELEQTKNC